ncbi:uncharacterized protein YcfL [Paraburkholderia unamae]|nr:uncharacterized protein YcfL [Paraburkholderia unamae]
MALLLALVVPIPASAAGPAVDDAKIEYYEPMANVAVTSLSSAASGKGLAVSVVFTNSSSRSQGVYYRVVWLDQTGNAISGRVPWSGIAINGNSAQSVSLTTADPAASSYRLQLSLGKNF